MAVRTRAAVLSRTLSEAFRTRDTVAVDTPAFCATARMSMFRFVPRLRSIPFWERRVGRRMKLSVAWDEIQLDNFPNPDVRSSLKCKALHFVPLRVEGPRHGRRHESFLGQTRDHWQL